MPRRRKREEILSQMKGTWKYWVCGVAAGIASTKTEEMMQTLRDNALAKALGIVDGDEIDVDIILNELRKRSGEGPVDVSIPMIGTIKLTSNDIDLLQKHIRNA